MTQEPRSPNEQPNPNGGPSFEGPSLWSDRPAEPQIPQAPQTPRATPGSQQGMPGTSSAGFGGAAGQTPYGNAQMYRQSQSAPLMAPRPDQPMTPHPGAPQQAPVGPVIQPYRRSAVWLWVIPIAVLALVAALLYFGNRREPVISYSPTPVPSRASSQPPTPRNTGIPATQEFKGDRGAGTFTVNSSSWDGQTLTINVTITLTDGNLSTQLRAMDVKTGDIYTSNPPTKSGDLKDGIISAGTTVTGDVRFLKNRDDTQIVLGDSRDLTRNLTIIRVPA